MCEVGIGEWDLQFKYACINLSQSSSLIMIILSLLDNLPQPTSLDLEANKATMVSTLSQRIEAVLVKNPEGV